MARRFLGVTLDGEPVFNEEPRVYGRSPVERVWYEESGKDDEMVKDATIVELPRGVRPPKDIFELDDLFVDELMAMYDDDPYFEEKLKKESRDDVGSWPSDFSDLVDFPYEGSFEDRDFYSELARIIAYKRRRFSDPLKGVVSTSPEDIKILLERDIDMLFNALQEVRYGTEQ